MLKVFLILNAANWLMIQGTQKEIGHHPWAFVQVRAEKNNGEIVIKNGVNKTPYSYIKPTLTKQSELQLARLRLGIRGAFDENNINYFILSEIAQNGVNNPLGYSTPTYITDASFTLKYLPIFVRAGKFKFAGSEEGNMARFVSPFINFTSLSNQLMLERFVNTDGTPAQGVGAYRDTGIQLFNAFDIGDKSRLTLSYMFGNGSGTANKNVNSNKFTHYGFLSYEYKLGGGKGYHNESVKFYLWAQNGQRLYRDELYDRERYGVGFTYFKNYFRVEAEYMQGKGMIVSGVKDANSGENIDEWIYTMSPDSTNVADGYYLLSTYEIIKSLELLARYDTYNRLTNDAIKYRKFETITTGLSYRFNNYDRIDVNYAINSTTAPQNDIANTFLKETVGNLLSLQLTMVFK